MPDHVLQRPPDLRHVSRQHTRGCERETGWKRESEKESERDTALSCLAWHNQFDTLHKVRTLDYCD